jgi:hypothetical protein
MRHHHHGGHHADDLEGAVGQPLDDLGDDAGSGAGFEPYVGSVVAASAKDAVRAALQDPNPLVRDNAREAIRKLH